MINQAKFYTLILKCFQTRFQDLWTEGVAPLQCVTQIVFANLGCRNNIWFASISAMF